VGLLNYLKSGVTAAEVKKRYWSDRSELLQRFFPFFQDHLQKHPWKVENGKFVFIIIFSLDVVLNRKISLVFCLKKLNFRHFDFIEVKH